MQENKMEKKIDNNEETSSSSPSCYYKTDEEWKKLVKMEKKRKKWKKEKKMEKKRKKEKKMEKKRKKWKKEKKMEKMEAKKMEKKSLNNRKRENDEVLSCPEPPKRSSSQFGITAHSRELLDKETLKTKNSGAMKYIDLRSEAQDRFSRRNNIIISGLMLTDGNVREKVNNFIRDEFFIAESVVEASIINKNKNLIVARMSNWDLKVEIMRTRKAILDGRGIFINQDLTPNERAIYRKIRALAKAEILKGNIVEVMHHSICINGERIYWNDRLQKLVPVRSPSGSKRTTTEAQTHEYNNNNNEKRQFNKRTKEKYGVKKPRENGNIEGIHQLKNEYFERSV